MKQLFFYALFWAFSASLNATDKVEAIVQQTFSKPHAIRITEAKPVRLKDIDMANPLFIFR